MIFAEAVFSTVEKRCRMKKLTRETWQVIRYNFKNILLMELVYRLITGPIYLQLVSQGMRFALRMAGYSYLTAGNVGFFLLKPWTLICIAGIGFVGAVLLMLEIGSLITMFEGAAYFQKVGFMEAMFGGLKKLMDECKRRNYRLLLLTMIYYLLTNLYLVYRILTHVKPLNFVLSEMAKQPVTRLGMVILVIFCVMIAAPGIYTFYGCMIEQKNYRDGYRRSRSLLKGHWGQTYLLMVGYNVLCSVIMVLAYGICVMVAAVFVAIFTDKNLAMAVLLDVCDKIEIVILGIFSMVIVVVNFAALTVQYYQYSNRLNREPRWDFAFPRGKSKSRQMMAGIVASVTCISLFLIFDLVRNGSSLANNVLTQIQITAHRGSSKSAPENTMSAIRLAVEELADSAEIDVQETKDGVVVLCHDSSLKRVAGVNRTVGSYTFEELEQLDVGSWFSPEYKGERIPALEEVMQYCKGRLNLNIEIKSAGKSSGLPEKVVELIERYGMEEQCVITSTNFSYLKRIKEINPLLYTGYIISAAYGDYYSSDDIDFISIRSSFVTERLVEDAHGKGKMIHAWTVNNKSEMERMKLLGADNVITDYPVLAREIIYREEATETLMEYIRLVFK